MGRIQPAEAWKNEPSDGSGTPAVSDEIPPIPSGRVSGAGIAGSCGGSGPPTPWARIIAAEGDERLRMTNGPDTSGSGAPRPSRLEAILAEDVAFEPPRSAVSRALGLSAAVASRRPPAWNPIAVIGTAFDQAGAIVAGWLAPPAEPALAGLRDDRGAESIASEPTPDGLSVGLDRIPSVDGRVRLVGEVLLDDGAPLRGEVAVIDGAGAVVATAALDAVGMFALDLPETGRALVATVARADGRLVRPVVLPMDRASDDDFPRGAGER
jgi:hypothetical protein